MARVGDIKFVPTVAPGTTAILPLDEIPQEIKDEVEDVYKALKDAPVSGNFRVQYDTKQELLSWESMVKAYCEQRPGGKVKYRRSPVRGLAPTEIAFRITDINEATEKATKDVKDTKEAAKTSARKARVKPE